MTAPTFSASENAIAYPFACSACARRSAALKLPGDFGGNSMHAIRRAGLAATVVLTAVLAGSSAVRAQLIDPNQGCVYQPGSTNCQPIPRGPQPPPAPPPVPPYQQFLQLVSNSNLD